MVGEDVYGRGPQLLLKGPLYVYLPEYDGNIGYQRIGVAPSELTYLSPPSGDLWFRGEKHKCVFAP
jgi:hypothetical protein